MKIFILTQEDAFYIPKLINVLASSLPESAHLTGMAILKGELRPSNAGDYLRIMGLWAFSITTLNYLGYRLMDLLGRAIGGKGLWSVAGSARRHNIPIHRPEKISADSFKQLLASNEIDLIISIACPQIVRKDLLEFPQHGCINVHGALLPVYRGKMPSFWVLAKGESKTGVTVHYMNEKLDDGPIIVQKEVPIREDDTLHSLVLRSKVEFGGQALAEAVELIMTDSVETMENPKSLGSYYSFPTDEAVAEFRSRGRKFR